MIHMNYRTCFLSLLCAATTLTFAAPVLRAQDDASTILDGAQKGIEKLKKEMKAQSESRKQIQEFQQQLKTVSDKQAELTKELESLQQARRESEASEARQTDKIQHLSRQVEHLEALAQEYEKNMESMKKAPTPPVQSTPGATPASEPVAAPTPAS